MFEDIKNRTIFVNSIFLKDICEKIIKEYFYNHMCRPSVIDDILEIYQQIEIDVFDITLEKISEIQIRKLLDNHCALEILMKNNRNNSIELIITDSNKFPGVFTFGSCFKDFVCEPNEKNIIKFIKEKIYFSSPDIEKYYLNLCRQDLKTYIEVSLIKKLEIRIPSICYD